MDKEKIKKNLKEILPYIIAIVVVLIIKNFVVSPVMVNGTSMDPTLRNKEIMILNRLKYKFDDIKRFDIVVIKKDSLIIKRIIGLPGETVEIIDNKLYINDKEIKEKFLNDDVITGDFQLEEKIPKGYYFVLGDNREVSADSRGIGLISKDEIEGHASLTIFPFNRFGTKK